MWFCNLVNSLIQGDFNEFIAEKLIKRKQNLLKSHNLLFMLIMNF